jgi:hypothetical protein
MKAIQWTILLAAALLLPGTVFAANFDGSKPLICALMGNFECDPEGCQRVTPEGINLPEFIRIDFEGKKVSTINDGVQARTTKIERFDRSDGRLYLQGQENGLAWSLVISESNGKMVLTMAGGEVGFAIFGACTIP